MWSAIWNDFFRPCGAWTDLFAVNPAMNRWAIVGRPEGTFFADILRKLREAGGLLADVFAQATPRFNNPVNLKRIIAMIDEEDWSAMDLDVKGAAFEGLLEKAASEGKKGAGQYFTPRPLIQAIVRVMKPDPRGRQGFTICDPACGTGGFLVCSYEWLVSKEVSGGVFDRADARRIKSQTFIGQDLVPRPRRLALMNLFLHGVEPHIYLGDAIYEPDRSERYDVVLTNPPFGTKGANQAPDRDDFTIETSKCLRTATTAQLRPARHDRAQARRTRRDGAAGQLPVRGQGRRSLRAAHAGLRAAHRPAPAARHVHALQPGRESQRHLFPERPAHRGGLDFRRALQRAGHHQERPPAHGATLRRV